MGSNYELKRTDNRTCYFCDDIIKTEDFDFYNIFKDEKSYENVLVYNISYKTLFGAKPLRIKKSTNHMDLLEFMMELLLLFSIAHVFSQSHASVKVYSYDSLPLTLTFHNVLIHIKSVFNKDQNHYYYNIFLENGSCHYLKITIINKFLYKL